jgi:hypothetical protein
MIQATSDRTGIHGNRLSGRMPFAGAGSMASARPARQAAFSDAREVR